VISTRNFHFSVEDAQPTRLEVTNAGGENFWFFVTVPEFTTDIPIGWSGATGECDTFDPNKCGCMNVPP